jgi:hypothetical protein
MGVSLLIGLLLSAAIGLSLGLIGGGGSIITVPVLVYVMGMAPRDAVSMSLAVVGATSLLGASLHYRNGAVDWRAGALFGGAGLAGAFFGARLTYLFSPAALLLAFAGLMLFVAGLMLLRGVRPEATRRKRSLGKALLVGLLVGGLTGFLGVGGGFLIVPALLLFGGLAMKEAVGTSLLVIAINCAAGLAGHLQHGGLNWLLTLLVTALAASGALVGTALSRRVSAKSLQKGFAVFVLAVALFLVAKNYTILFG